MTTLSFAEMLSEMDSGTESSLVENQGWSSIQDPAGLSFLIGQIRSKKFTTTLRSAYQRPQYQQKPTNDHPQTAPSPAFETTPVEEGYELSFEQEMALSWLNQQLPSQRQLQGRFQLQQLNKAFKKAALKAHPDCGGSHESFLKLKHSHEILVTFLNTIK